MHRFGKGAGRAGGLVHGIQMQNFLSDKYSSDDTHCIGEKKMLSTISGKKMAFGKS